MIFFRTLLMLWGVVTVTAPPPGSTPLGPAAALVAVAGAAMGGHGEAMGELCESGPLDGGSSSSSSSGFPMAAGLAIAGAGAVACASAARKKRRTSKHDDARSNPIPTPIHPDFPRRHMEQDPDTGKWVDCEAPVKLGAGGKGKSTAKKRKPRRIWSRWHRFCFLMGREDSDETVALKKTSKALKASLNRAAQEAASGDLKGKAYYQTVETYERWENFVLV